jgi:hypothetical protein
MTVISPNNRHIQNLLGFYKLKSEISEAISELKKVFSPATIDFLTQFTFTDNGVTQMKITEILKRRGISASTYSKTIKPEIETLLGEPIVETRETQKNDHSRTKKVRGSAYKILIPLRKIKYLIKKYLKQKHAQEIAELQAFRADLLAIPGDDIENDIKSDIESDAEKPRQDSAEIDFSNGQNKSLRENLSEKDINKLNITDLFIVKNFGKIKITNTVKNYLNTFPLFRDFMSWSESKRYEIAKTIQLAIIKTETDIEEPKPQIMIKRAIGRFMSEYADKPKNEFFRLLYTFVFNSLKNDEEDHSEPSEDHSEDDEPMDEPIPGSWESVKPTLRRLLDEKPASDLSHEEKVAEIEDMLKKLDDYRENNSERIQDLDDQGVF